jgi:hypothetical protein
MRSTACWTLRADRRHSSRASSRPSSLLSAIANGRSGELTVSRAMDHNTTLRLRRASVISLGSIRLEGACSVHIARWMWPLKPCERFHPSLSTKINQRESGPRRIAPSHTPPAGIRSARRLYSSSGRVEEDPRGRRIQCAWKNLAWFAAHRRRALFTAQPRLESSAVLPRSGNCDGPVSRSRSVIPACCRRRTASRRHGRH